MFAELLNPFRGRTPRKHKSRAPFRAVRKNARPPEASHDGCSSIVPAAPGDHIAEDGDSDPYLARRAGNLANIRSAQAGTPRKGGRRSAVQAGVRICLAGTRPAAGDRRVVEAAENGEVSQVLLGVTGSGKTFTMAKVIEKLQRPALVIAPNKILAAQLTASSRASSPATRSNISSVTTTTTSPKPTSRAPTPISRRNRV
jgi:hypothetical protein